MSTKKSSESIIIDEKSLINTLSVLAKKEQKTVSRLALDLILDALERREDIVLSAIADLRMREENRSIVYEEIQ